METYRAINKIKLGKAPGVRGIYPEYIRHGGNALYAMHRIFTRVWEEDVVPEEWHQGLIILLYKGKGSKSDCCNYRGITLLSVPGKVFAYFILARIRPTLLQHRQQSGFTPGRSTCDRIATLCKTAQWRQALAIQLVQHMLISVPPFSEQICTLWLLLSADKAWYPGQDSHCSEPL